MCLLYKANYVVLCMVIYVIQHVAHIIILWSFSDKLLCVNRYRKMGLMSAVYHEKKAIKQQLNIVKFRLSVTIFIYLFNYIYI